MITVLSLKRASLGNDGSARNGTRSELCSGGESVGLGDDGYIKLLKCPVCGKMFFPAYSHAYHDGENKYAPIVCSYSCSRVNSKNKAKPSPLQAKPQRRNTYTVYDNVHKQFVCTNVTSEAAAEALRMSNNSFRSTYHSCSKGKNKKWLIIKTGTIEVESNSREEL